MKAIFLLTPLFTFSAPAAPQCEKLVELRHPHATVTIAQEIGASPELPAYCRVAATLKPTTDSDIKIEVWMPAAHWNGKFLADGNGGWAGSISPETLAAGLRDGYATAMTDTGHQGSCCVPGGDSASFAMGHPEKLIDFGYRAEHEMAVAAKAIVKAYYGQPAKVNYFRGCSGGGRQALMEAQRFPEDYDGIIAGAPLPSWTGRAIPAIVVASRIGEAGYIPPSKYAVIHQAVLDACDAQDGVKDGVLEDPRRCRFDPKEIQCKDEDGPNCLTAKQVETARAMYTPIEFHPSYMRGSELGWDGIPSPRPYGAVVDLFRYVVFENPNWDFRSFNLANDAASAEKMAGPILNATNPDLRAFLARGGKLIQYHGWNDSTLVPGFSVEYYENVLKLLGGAGKVRDGYRLFMVPGMAHCGGGEGTDRFDRLAALEGWVEKRQAPDRIVASRVKEGKVDRTRPLCPYPEVAAYKGTGSTDDAANFACKASGPF
jgi:feruloyl esterase